MENLLYATLDADEADFLLEVATTVTGEELSEREQILLLIGVRYMQHRDARLLATMRVALAGEEGE
jgi:hypothetical protein